MAKAQAFEQQATQEAIQKAVNESLKETEEEDKETAEYHKKLSAEESQTLILQSVDKKRKRDQRERAKYDELIKNRLAPEEITSVTVTPSADNMVNLHIKRQGFNIAHSLPSVQESHLGPTEWIEIYPLVAHKKSVAAQRLLKMLDVYFNKISRMEAKLGVTNSILKVSTAKIPVTQPATIKRRRTEPPQQRALEMLINTELPSNVPVGAHGEVITSPELGMFYQTFNSGTRFYRAADLNLSDSETLIRMYGICTTISGNIQFASLMLEELNRRKDEPLIKRFFLGELDVKPRNVPRND